MSEILMKIFWLTEGGSGLLGVKFPEEFELCSGRILDGLNTGRAIFTRDEQVKIANAYRAFCRAVGRKSSQGKKLPWEEDELGPWAEFEDFRTRVGYYADLFRSRGRGPVPRPRRLVLMTEDEQLEFWE